MGTKSEYCHCPCREVYLRSFLFEIRIEKTETNRFFYIDYWRHLKNTGHTTDFFVTVASSD